MPLVYLMYLMCHIHIDTFIEVDRYSTLFLSSFFLRGFHIFIFPSPSPSIFYLIGLIFFSSFVPFSHVIVRFLIPPLFSLSFSLPCLPSFLLLPFFIFFSFFLFFSHSFSFNYSLSISFSSLHSFVFTA